MKFAHILCAVALALAACGSPRPEVAQTLAIELPQRVSLGGLEAYQFVNALRSAGVVPQMADMGMVFITALTVDCQESATNASCKLTTYNGPMTATGPVAAQLFQTLAAHGKQSGSTASASDVRCVTSAGGSLSTTSCSFKL